MVTSTTAGFIACLCFLATCDFALSGYGVLPPQTPPPPAPGHNHNQNHGQGQIHNHGHNNHGHNHGQQPPAPVRPLPNPVQPVKPVAPLTPVRPQIPAGYRTFPGVGSYKFHAVGTTWNDAKNTCNREGTKMLIINSNAEAEAIKTLFRANPNSPGALNSNHVWVGVQEKGKHGEFITNNGQRLEQTGFLVWSKSPQQPNDPGNNDCVSYYSAGTLYDDACNLKYPFVCEV